MKTFIFFKSTGALVAMLQWSLSVKGLAMRLEQQRLRKCDEGHVKWMETAALKSV